MKYLFSSVAMVVGGVVSIITGNTEVFLAVFLLLLAVGIGKWLLCFLEQKDNE